ncbi:UDP-2,4-diacetamido-2,4,6-trideoxy-beta-L-altropyranose hydrolase [Agarivorans litoreus]|uniref:UDP-2,4-diacetamido-2,4, 6-trideoxy-beta-L-altropyranose hydrolase n=1 Tax=Agarivorans litoreus TaxID=1510455 RepID=UPI001C7D44AF|nr:UDP-2,4-diacetamido-2,4,6-trideoxy-beta-L-altropyranose hydrolase [Agarivorans litoreus]
MSNCIIRVDASIQIGSGHVYRCISLAKALEETGVEVTFLCRSLKGNLNSLIAQQGFELLTLTPPLHQSLNSHCSHANWLESTYADEIKESQSIIQQFLAEKKITTLDWLIIDHYAIEQQWHLSLRPYCKRLIQIDDLADRKFNCDFLINSSVFPEQIAYYDGLVNSKCKTLLGPQFAFIRKSFSEQRMKLKPYKERMNRKTILMFFGGVDSKNETLKALKGTIESIKSNMLNCTVVLGINNPNKGEIERFCQNRSEILTVKIQVNNMEQLMSEAFLFIGANGSTIWECCTLGLPAITASIASNQALLAKTLDNKHIIRWLGDCNNTQETSYSKALELAINDRKSLQKQSKLMLNLLDGQGSHNTIRYIEDIKHDSDNTSN